MIRIAAWLVLFSGFVGTASFAQQCACQEPSQWIAGACVPPSNANNRCDDGAVSGTPSNVASSVSGASPALKFQSLVNKKLACCLNSFDPLTPGTLKYDCVDNSAATTGSFDDLWTGTDPNDSGAEPYAVALVTGGNSSTPGKAITGFYTLSGSRCSEYSEFAGPIKSAKVNPGQMSGQQEKIGGSNCAISLGTYSVTPPAELTTGVTAAGKKLPYDGLATNDCTQAANMRRCPILVRAAMVATCPRNPSLPVVQTSYQDAMGATHCLAASTVRFYIRMEQIYEVMGMPRMQTIDTLQEQSSVNSISIANLIQSKLGNACPGMSSLSNGVCMGCSAGCGNTRCTACPADTYSDLGNFRCTPCPTGQTSPPGSSSCM